MDGVIDHYGKAIVALVGVIAVAAIMSVVVVNVKTKTTSAVDNMNMDTYEQQIQESLQ